MKRVITLLLALLMVLSLVACGDQTSTEESSATNEQTKSTIVESEETGSAEESTESEETPASAESEEISASTESEEESPASAESEEEIPAFSVEKLSVWGLPEPSFEYEMVGYCETMNGPDICPMLVYRASGNFETASAYAALVSNAGFLNPDNGAYIPDPEGENCTYSGVLGDCKVNVVNREGSGVISIVVIDRSKSAVWDDNVDAYVVPEYGEYGSYGEYNLELSDY